MARTYEEAARAAIAAGCASSERSMKVGKRLVADPSHGARVPEGSHRWRDSVAALTVLTALSSLVSCNGEARDEKAVEALLAMESPYASPEVPAGNEIDPIHGFFAFASPPGFEMEVMRGEPTLFVQEGERCSGLVSRSWIQFTDGDARIAVNARNTYCADRDFQTDVEAMIERMRGGSDVQNVRDLPLRGVSAGEVLAVAPLPKRRIHTVRFREHGIDHSIRLSCPAGTYHRYQRTFLDFLGGYRSIEPVLQRVYFLVGHGERVLEGGADEKRGYSLAATALRKQNHIVESLLLESTAEVPADADAVVVAGPTRPLPAAERDALHRYLEGGGGVLVLVDPRAQTDVVELLRGWGVDLADDIIVDRTLALFGRATSPFASRYDENHEITRGLREKVLFHMARSVKPASDAEGDYTEIVFTGQDSWAERDLDRFFARGAAQLGDDDLRGPVPIAVAGTPTLGEAEPRLAVFGDSDWAANELVESHRNRDLFVNAVNWVVGGVEPVSTVSGEGIGAALIGSWTPEGEDYIEETWERPRIATPEGDLLIVEIEITDRFPPGCELGPDGGPTYGCSKARDGYRFLSFRLERAAGEKFEVMTDAVLREAYITADSGHEGILTQIREHRVGDQSWEDNEILLGFGIPDAASNNFTLFLPAAPGRSPVEASESLDSGREPGAVTP